MPDPAVTPGAPVDRAPSFGEMRHPGLKQFVRETAEEVGYAVEVVELPLLLPLQEIADPWIALVAPLG